jgi:hypothetical protein
VLKKAGIIVAGSAAALLAVSPLAFAGESGHGGHHPHGHSADQVNYVGDSGSHSNGLVAVGDVNALNNVNVCPPVTAGIAIGDLLGALGTAAAPTTGGDATCVNDNSISQRNRK